MPINSLHTTPVKTLPILIANVAIDSSTWSVIDWVLIVTVITLAAGFLSLLWTHCHTILVPDPKVRSRVVAEVLRELLKKFFRGK